MSGDVSLVDAIRADHRALVANQRKYSGRTGRGSLTADLLRNVGLQQLAWFRLSAWLGAGRCRPLAMLTSRIGRYVFGADLHWDASIEPGVVIVHGTGLVIAPDAHVSTGCVLSQHVTLGASRGPDGRHGAPRLGTDVHVGPGAVVIGPVEVGAGTKIAPNALVTTHVPANSIVSPADSVIRPRHAASAPSAEAAVR